MRRKWFGLGGLLAAGLLGAAVVAGAATANTGPSVPAVPVDDNPTCQDLGFDFEYKVDPPDAGTYTVGSLGTITVVRDGAYFDWSSTFGIDAVIAKGGPNANLYTYDPPEESFGDFNLVAQTNPSNGMPYGLSHISFCYDYELAVSKTAMTTYTRTWNWTIDKSVVPDSWDLFKGDSGTSAWTVKVDKTGYTDSEWKVWGSITIVNPAPMAATITAVSDVVSPAIGATVDCGVSFPYTLAAGGTLSCSYMSALPDASARVNTATVTTTGMVDGGTATADVVFGEPTKVVNASVNVTDTNGMKWGPVSDDATWTYDETFACDADEGKHTNKATITETGQYDEATVTVDCYDIAVTKDAAASFNREWQWEITKSVTPATLDMFTGDSGSVEYTVAVDKKGYVDSGFAVAGKISVDNPAPIPAEIKSIADVVSPDIAATVDCGVTFPYTIAAGGTLNCTYSAALPDKTSRVNTATAALQNYDYDSKGAGTKSGTTAYTGTANVVFGDTPAKILYAAINVTDTNGMSWGPVSDDASWKYSRTFVCDKDEGKHDNTATITETKQSDDATVTVNCYALEVTKSAKTSYTRTWSWTIDKSADQTELILSDGQLFQVNYQVKVDATYKDSDWAVAGKIWVKNGTPLDAMITGVKDVITGVDPVAVTCPVTFPYKLVAGATLECSYSAALPDKAARMNTATATLQNTPSGTTDFSGSAKVEFNGPTTEIDECIDVSDTNVGFLGKVCAGDAPKTFKYALWLGANPDADVILECGDINYRNIASFVTNDTGSKGSDSWTITGTIACDYGCTLTPGYWKTHSKLGPAPYDDTWAIVDLDHDTYFEEHDETFFFSGKTYYEALWTAPKGNAYWILAHAYIAARLNIANGASMPDNVEDAFNAAFAYFHDPANTAIAPTGALRTNVLFWAYVLDDYNNGYYGPGHCSE